MRKFLLTLLCFIAFNLVLMILLAEYPRYRFDWSTKNTDSLLYIMTDDVQYDFVMLGTSHGKVFDRGSHEEVEAILGKSFLNLSRGGGGGIVPALVYLDLFFQRGNSAKTVFYLIDPYVFYARIWNEGRFFAEDEPLNLRFLYLMYRHGMCADAIWNYLQTKFSFSWFVGPETHWGLYDRKSGSVDTVDSALVRARIERLYLEGTKASTADYYMCKLEEVRRMAEAHSANLVLLFPPTLLGIQPGQEEIRASLEAYATAHADVSFHDGSLAIPESRYYYNLDHLNFEGLRYATEHLFKPALAGQTID